MAYIYKCQIDDGTYLNVPLNKQETKRPGIPGYANVFITNRGINCKKYMLPILKLKPLHVSKKNQARE